MTNPKKDLQIPQVEVQTKAPSPLDNAPDEIKLAVDLIYLLESNEVDKETAIKALEIVLSDFKNK
ncbi:pleiotropic regulatory protein RsmS [Aliivibrio fischeri]|uniref:Primosomal protein n=1 Tax=Aliivibrio fischeri TaxID=668 RepID=A0A510UDL4_ALIFS|nr:pleiotropic regulatory protein RsmS [Aliivibrio fischeri]GEK12636.1 hypothetical protein AFI02nite_06720 [Aliivibrio fischeri]